MLHALDLSRVQDIHRLTSLVVGGVLVKGKDLIPYPVRYGKILAISRACMFAAILRFKGGHYG